MTDNKIDTPIYVNLVATIGGPRYKFLVDEDLQLSLMAISGQFPEIVALLYFDSTEKKYLPLKLNNEKTKYCPPTSGWNSRDILVIEPVKVGTSNGGSHFDELVARRVLDEKLAPLSDVKVDLAVLTEKVNTLTSGLNVVRTQLTDLVTTFGSFNTRVTSLQTGLAEVRNIDLRDIRNEINSVKQSRFPVNWKKPKFLHSFISNLKKK